MESTVFKKCLIFKLGIGIPFLVVIFANGKTAGFQSFFWELEPRSVGNNPTK